MRLDPAMAMLPPPHCGRPECDACRYGYGCSIAFSYGYAQAAAGVTAPAQLDTSSAYASDYGSSSSGCGSDAGSIGSRGSRGSGSSDTEVEGCWLDSASVPGAGVRAPLAGSLAAAAAAAGGGRRARVMSPPVGAPVARSVLQLLDDAYGGEAVEVGYETAGHRCIDGEDVEAAAGAHASLLYGEVLPAGVSKALDRRHLAAANARCLFDLGSGTGKLAMQAFLMFPNLEEVLGVELAGSRYVLAEAAVGRLLAANRKRFRLHACTPGVEVAICEDAAGGAGGGSSSGSGNAAPPPPGHGAGTCASTGTRRCRVLHLRCGNVFDMPAATLRRADVLVVEIDLPDAMHARLCHHLALARAGTRVLSYLNLRDIWPRPGTAAYVPCPLRQATINLSASDRFSTSWAAAIGHHFFMWRVVADAVRYLSGVPSVHVRAGVPPHFADYVADALRADREVVWVPPRARPAVPVAPAPAPAPAPATAPATAAAPSPDATRLAAKPRAAIRGVLAPMDLSGAPPPELLALPVDALGRRIRRRRADEDAARRRGAARQTPTATPTARPAGAGSGASVGVGAAAGPSIPSSPALGAAASTAGWST